MNHIYTFSRIAGLVLVVTSASVSAASGQCPCPECYRLYSPNGGETIQAGTTYRIEWDIATCSCCDDPADRIELSTDGGNSWTTIVEQGGLMMEYYWDVPALTSNSCLIRICGSIDDPCDTSDAVFAITDTLPEPGAEWMVANCDEPTLDGLYLPPWTTVDIYDHDGVRCASRNISIMSGIEGMRIYADDPKTADDEGADPGEVLQVHVDGRPVFTDPPLVWTGHGDMTQLCNFHSERCYPLALDSGWHLISWPVEFSAPLEELITGWSGCIDVMLGFNHGGQIYNPSFPALATLTEVGSRYGYWVRLSCPVDAEVCGPASAIYESQTVFPGWNLVGYHARAAAPADLALAPISEKIEVAYGFDSGFEVWDPAAEAHSTLDSLHPGHGYWIRVNETCEWDW